MAAAAAAAAAPVAAPACDDIVDVLHDLHVLLWQHKQLVLDDQKAETDVALWNELHTLPAKVKPSFQLVAIQSLCHLVPPPPLPQKLFLGENLSCGSLSTYSFNSAGGSSDETPHITAAPAPAGTPKHLIVEGTRPQKFWAQAPTHDTTKKSAIRSPEKQAVIHLAHAQGSCKPCLFWNKGVCFKKSDCAFCHLPHDTAQIRHVRPSKNTRLCLEKRSIQRKQDLERKCGK